MEMVVIMNVLLKICILEVEEQFLMLILALLV